MDEAPIHDSEELNESTVIAAVEHQVPGESPEWYADPANIGLTHSEHLSVRYCNTYNPETGYCTHVDNHGGMTDEQRRELQSQVELDLI